MELLIAALVVIFLTILSGILFFSFADKDVILSKKKKSHLKGQKKIMTQDGMVVKKSKLSEPLFLMGDSKVIRQ